MIIDGWHVYSRSSRQARVDQNSGETLHTREAYIDDSCRYTSMVSMMHQPQVTFGGYERRIAGLSQFEAIHIEANLLLGKYYVVTASGHQMFSE